MRKPVTTSSKMSRAPYRRARAAAPRTNSLDRGRVPLSGPMGSRYTAAVPPVRRFARSFRSRSSRSLGKNSSVCWNTKPGTPLDSSPLVPGTRIP